jgi:hypothetical protein
MPPLEQGDTDAVDLTLEPTRDPDELQSLLLAAEQDQADLLHASQNRADADLTVKLEMKDTISELTEELALVRGVLARLAEKIGVEGPGERSGSDLLEWEDSIVVPVWEVLSKTTEPIKVLMEIAGENPGLLTTDVLGRLAELVGVGRPRTYIPALFTPIVHLRAA